MARRRRKNERIPEVRKYFGHTLVFDPIPSGWEIRVFERGNLRQPVGHKAVKGDFAKALELAKDIAHEPRVPNIGFAEVGAAVAGAAAAGAAGYALGRRALTHRDWEGAVLRVGDQVRKEGDTYQVTGIELVEPGEKGGGVKVQELPWALVWDDYAVVDMDGAWSRGSDLEPTPEDNPRHLRRLRNSLMR